MSGKSTRTLSPFQEEGVLAQSLPRHERTVTMARHLAEHFVLTVWELPNDQFVWDLLTALTEMVANALRFGPVTFRLSLRRPLDDLIARIEVDDHNQVPLGELIGHIGIPVPDTESGLPHTRLLAKGHVQLVRHSDEGGRTIWAELGHRCHRQVPAFTRSRRS
jgi:hypothetical protein